jgi:hypothetical protein
MDVHDKKSESSFERLPPLDNKGVGELLPLDARIGVGFGDAELLRNGDLVWAEHGHMAWEDLKTVAEAESMAAADPEQDWRIRIWGPLSGATWQRQGVERWVLVEKNQGFA